MLISIKIEWFIQLMMIKWLMVIVILIMVTLQMKLKSALQLKLKKLMQIIGIYLPGWLILRELPMISRE